MRPAKPLIPLLYLLLALALTQCSRSEEEGSKPAAEQSAPDGQPMRLTDAGRDRTLPDDRDEPPPPASDPLPSVDPRDAAFSAYRLAAAPHYPVDFLIGPLRVGGLSTIESNGRAAARRFLESLAREGEAPAGSLSTSAVGLALELGELASEIPPDAVVRVGRPTALASAEYSFPFRFAAREADWVGELVMEMAEGRWYTSDVQADRRDVDRNELFTPGGDVPGASW